LIDREGHQPPGSVSDSGPDNLMIFVRRSHELLGMGYATLTPSVFSDTAEPVITYRLVQAVDNILRDNTELWMIPFSIQSDPLIYNNPNRPEDWPNRLDIRIEFSKEGGRSYLWFEAKRLEPRNHNVWVYLGSEGLLRFVEGRCAKDEAIGGMLGYVQKGVPEDWAKKIGEAMSNDPTKVRLRKDRGWRAESQTDGIPFGYCSDHDRPSGKPIRIYHSLLIFN